MASARLVFFMIVSSTLFLSIYSSPMKNLTKTISLGSNITYMDLIMQKTTLHYALCHDTEQSEKNCILKTIFFPFDDTVKEEMKCPFTINVEKNYKMGHHIRVYPIKDYETVLVWGETHVSNESSLLKILVVSKPDCKKHPNELILAHKIPNIDMVVRNLMILAHSYTYELIYEDEMTCNGKCYVIYDSEGLGYAGPSALNVSAIPKKSGQFTYRDPKDDLFKRDHCIGLISEERLNASLFFTEQVDHLLMDSKTKRNSKVRVSTDHGFLSLCIQEVAYSNGFQCSRDDLTTWVNFTFEHDVQDFIVHNLADGGYLFLTSKHLKTYEKANSHQILLAKFDKDGFIQDGAHVAYSVYCTSPIDMHVHIYEDDEGHYCISLLEESTSLYLLARCFEENDLSKYYDNFDTLCGRETHEN